MKQEQIRSVRSKIIKARLTEDEYRDFRQKREDSGLNESEFIRRAVFGGKISGNLYGTNQKSDGESNLWIMSEKCQF